MLIDLNVGQGRCGVEPGEAAVVLAHRAAQTEGITLRGVMGYEATCSLFAIARSASLERERR